MKVITNSRDLDATMYYYDDGYKNVKTPMRTTTSDGHDDQPLSAIHPQKMKTAGYRVSTGVPHGHASGDHAARPRGNRGCGEPLGESKMFAKKLTPNFVQLTQDACLKAFWRRPALRAYLRQHGVSESKLATWHGDETKRVFLQRLFPELLAVRDNKGHAVILAMARSLAEMTHFPDLERWEDSKEKFAAAREAVARLKKQVDALDEQIQDKRDTQERRKKAREQLEQTLASRQSLKKLEDRLTALVAKQGTAQGGYDFERWFYDLANYFELSARPPYKAGGRQIDGSLHLDGTDFLIETKFTTEPTGAPDIDTFMKKIIRKADNTMGICVSMAGFTSIAVDEASCDRTPMLLMDYSHICNLILSGTMTLPDVIRRIKRHASQTGSAFLPIGKFSG